MDVSQTDAGDDTGHGGCGCVHPGDVGTVKGAAGENLVVEFEQYSRWEMKPADLKLALGQEILGYSCGDRVKSQIKRDKSGEKLEIGEEGTVTNCYLDGKNKRRLAVTFDQNGLWWVFPTDIELLDSYNEWEGRPPSDDPSLDLDDEEIQRRDEARLWDDLQKVNTAIIHQITELTERVEKTQNMDSDTSKDDRQREIQQLQKTIEQLKSEITQVEDALSEHLKNNVEAGQLQTTLVQHLKKLDKLSQEVQKIVGGGWPMWLLPVGAAGAVLLACRESILNWFAGTKSESGETKTEEEKRNNTHSTNSSTEPSDWTSLGYIAAAAASLGGLAWYFWPQLSSKWTNSGESNSETTVTTHGVDRNKWSNKCGDCSKFLIGLFICLGVAVIGFVCYALGFFEESPEYEEP